MMEHLILEAISIHPDEKKVIRCRFPNGKSCLTKLIAFYDERTTWVNKGRAVDVVYLNLSKAINTISHSILRGKLSVCGLDEWTVEWIQNWLNSKPREL
ncbi:hypothetical protein WISP_136234 [Willisornis vidua]|uniref:Uncharacterized protein n=1 Tax=Willisornis vidua TaxID=1566151 RepID=A0ABQ9CND8_9PASS|nr:hypothetical protein WISP_136234 [Willisornis vidua]